MREYSFISTGAGSLFSCIGGEGVEGKKGATRSLLLSREGRKEEEEVDLFGSWKKSVT